MIQLRPSIAEPCSTVGSVEDLTIGGGCLTSTVAW